MPEEHPSTSAVGLHLDEEIAALAHQYYEEEGRPEGRSQEHWLRAERDVRSRSGTPPSEPGFAPESGAL